MIDHVFFFSVRQSANHDSKQVIICIVNSMSFVRVLIKFEATFYAVLHESQYTMDDVNNHYNYMKTKGKVLVILNWITMQYNYLKCKCSTAIVGRTKMFIN